MHTVHFTLQGKGGVGKSYVSSLIAQYLQLQGLPVIGIDTDPINATLSGYASLGALRLELMTEGATTVNERAFDALIERVLREDAHFVIDNGAASYVALSNYLIENDAIPLIAGAGKQVVVHTIVTGGQAMLDTLSGFADLAEQLPDEARLIVWLNEFFGDIHGRSANDAVVPFEAMKAYRDVKARVHALVRLPKQSYATFGKDIELMLDAKLTFADIAVSERFGLMAKQRLKSVQRRIFDQLAVAL